LPGIGGPSPSPSGTRLPGTGMDSDGVRWTPVPDSHGGFPALPGKFPIPDLAGKQGGNHRFPTRPESGIGNLEPPVSRLGVTRPGTGNGPRAPSGSSESGSHCPGPFRNRSRMVPAHESTGMTLAAECIPSGPTAVDASAPTVLVTQEIGFPIPRVISPGFPFLETGAPPAFPDSPESGNGKRRGMER
jgi:hypothetical protein